MRSIFSICNSLNYIFFFSEGIREENKVNRLQVIFGGGSKLLTFKYLTNSKSVLAFG